MLDVYLSCWLNVKVNGSTIPAGRPPSTTLLDDAYKSFNLNLRNYLIKKKSINPEVPTFRTTENCQNSMFSPSHLVLLRPKSNHKQLCLTLKIEFYI